MRRHPKEPVYSSCRGSATARRLTAAGLSLLVAALLGAILAASALAAPGYQPGAEFGSGDPGSGRISVGARVAVDDVTGDVLEATVVREAPGVTAKGVFVYGPGGALLGRIGEGSVNPGGIAVDQTDGDLYVADVNSGRILRYTTDRANPPTYTLDAAYNGPIQGPNLAAGQIGSLNSSLAIDPTDGDLLVADSAGLRVERYSPDGSFLGSFDGAGTEAGKFTSLVNLAVSPSGQIYIVQNGTENLELGIYVKGPIHGSRVARYAADGAGGNLLDGGPTLAEARAVGIDPDSGLVVVVTGGGGTEGSSALALAVFAPNGKLESTAPFTEAAAEGVTGGVAIAAGTGTLYSATETSPGATGVSGVQQFAPVEVPGVAIEAPSAVTPFAAQARGVVTPLGKATTYYFEYMSNRDSGWLSTVAAELPVGEEPVPVSAALALEPATNYRVRLVAEDGETRNVSKILLFSTPPAAPAVVTGPAGEVGTESAHIEGTINSLGSPATYQFEYGLTSSYGSNLPAVPGVAVVGRSPVTVETDIDGLQPGTLYHYRLVANGPGGPAVGEDRTFVTESVAPPARAFELVSPLDKGNVGVDVAHNTFFASADGNAMVFGTNFASYPGADATPYLPRVSAVRTPNGWLDKPTDPPSFNEISPENVFFGTIAVSADRTKALVVTLAALAPGAVSGEQNMYIRNLQTNQYTLIATGALGVEGGNRQAMLGTGMMNGFLGASPDLSIVAFEGGTDVAGPAYPQSEALSRENVYVWREGVGLSLIVKPDGTPFVSAPEARTLEQVHFTLKNPNQVSESSGRVYFSLQPNTPDEGLYLWENGTTYLVSASQRPGEEGNREYGQFLQASADGRFLFFSSGGGQRPPLTQDAPEGQSNLVYRYDAVTKELTYMAESARVFESLPAAGVLFYADESGGRGGERDVIYDHDGVNTVMFRENGSGELTQFNMSPNGRYFVFVTGAKLTAYENAGTEELYLYDTRTGALTCPSCRRDGGPPMGRAGIGLQGESEGVGIQRHGPRTVLDDGTVFFDTPEPLVARDVNGERDVYEYRDGRVALISDGGLVGESEFSDASPDGSNVFFTTNQQLVPRDKDHIFDLYDARVGGGFPEVEAEAEACGGRCGGEVVTPRASTNGSEAVAGNPKSRKSKKKHTPARCRKKSTKRSKGSGGAKCVKAGKHGRGQQGAGVKGKKHGKKGAGR